MENLFFGKMIFWTTGFGQLIFLPTHLDLDNWFFYNSLFCLTHFLTNWLFDNWFFYHWFLDNWVFDNWVYNWLILTTNFFLENCFFLILWKHDFLDNWFLWPAFFWTIHLSCPIHFLPTHLFGQLIFDNSLFCLTHFFNQLNCW